MSSARFIVAVIAGAAGSLVATAADDVPADPLCGLYCVTVAGHAVGAEVTFEQWRAELGEPTPAGYSLGELMRVAEVRGLYALPVSTTFENLRRREASGERFACIAHLDAPVAADPAAGSGAGAAGGHFVVFAGFDGAGDVHVIDPPSQTHVAPAVLTPRWDGVALLLANDPLTREEDLPTPIDWLFLLKLGLAVVAIAAGGAWAARRWSGRAAAAGAVAAFGFTGCGGASDEAHVPDAAGPPVARFLRTEVDLGEIAVAPGGYEAVFPVANRGRSDLTIERLVLGCGCVEAKPSKTLLKPGEEAEITVAVAPEQEETRRVVVTVHTDDPRAPTTDLKTRWRATAPRRLEPPRLDFGAVRPGQTLTRTVALPVRDVTAAGDPAAGDPGTVGTPTADAPLSARVEPPVDGRSDRVAVTLTVPDTPGTGRGAVVVPLTGGFAEALHLPVRWDVRPAAEARPPRLYLGSVAPGAKLNGRVTVVTADGLRAAGAEFADDAGAFAGGVVTLGEPAAIGGGATVRASFEATAPTAPGPHTAELRVRVDGGRPIVVPVAVLVAGE